MRFFVVPPQNDGFFYLVILSEAKDLFLAAKVGVKDKKAEKILLCGFLFKMR